MVLVTGLAGVVQQPERSIRRHRERGRLLCRIEGYLVEPSVERLTAILVDSRDCESRRVMTFRS